MMIFLREGASRPDDLGGHPSNCPAGGKSTCSADHSAEKNDKNEKPRKVPGERRAWQCHLKPHYDGAEQAERRAMQQAELRRNECDNGAGNQIHEHCQNEADRRGWIKGVLEPDPKNRKPEKSNQA